MAQAFRILCGLALWEQMQDCDRRGVPYTDIDIEAVSQEVAYDATVVLDDTGKYVNYKLEFDQKKAGAKHE